MGRSEDRGLHTVHGALGSGGRGATLADVDARSTPGGAADGVVVAAPAPQGISSALEALAALHRKGALTDSEFAAAKAKLLG